MNWQVVKTLVVKDVTLYFRDRFFAFITVLALVFYAVIYFVMPGSVDETLELALYAENLPPVLGGFLQTSGIELEQLESADAVQQSIEDRDYVAGIVVRGDASSDIELTLYLPPDTSPEREQSIVALFEGIGYAMGDEALNVNITQEVIGDDLVGRQIAFRKRILPLFAVLMIMMETMGLASLITEEVESRTVRALMVTPMNMGGLFLSKGIVGVGLAFIQATFLMAVTGGLREQPLLILFVLLLGSVMVTGVAFLIASVARDMMSVFGWGILAVLVLSVPAMTLMFPGGVSDWVKLIPTHWLVDAVNQAVNFGAGWGDLVSNIAVLVVTGFGSLVLGGLVLGRKLHES